VGEREGVPRGVGVEGLVLVTNRLRETAPTEREGGVVGAAISV